MNMPGSNGGAVGLAPMHLPEGSIEGGSVGGVGGGVGAPPAADLFRILEQASDAASIRIDPPSSAAPVGGHRGVSSPSSLTLANAGLPVGIADPAANLAASALKGKNGIAPAAAPKMPGGGKKAGGPAASNGKKRRGWRKPEGRPSRPLSAYNLFFQAEREAMVSKKTGGNCLGGIKLESEGSEEKKCDDENPNGEARPAKKRRRRGPPSGIGFATMAQTIAAKWKTLDGPSKTIFELKAAVDRERYEKQMAVWKKTDDFKKYEAERRRNAKNRGKGGMLNSLTAEKKGDTGDEIKPMPTPLPPVTGCEGGLTPLQRLFQGGGNGVNTNGGVGAPAIVSPEMLAAQSGQSHGTTNPPMLTQHQFLGPMQHLQAQHQAQGQVQPGGGAQMSALLNGAGGAEAQRLQQQNLQVRATGNSPLQQLAQGSALGQQRQTLHQVSPDVATKEQALLAQQQRQLQLIQQQELQVQGQGLTQGNMPSSMQQPPLQLQFQQDQFLQLLQQQRSFQGQAPNHPVEQFNEEEKLRDDLLQQMRRESLAGAGAGAAAGASTQASAGPGAAGQRGSLGLGSLFSAAGQGGSLGLGEAGAGTGKRDSLGLGSLFSPSGAGQRGSLGHGSIAGFASPNAASASAAEHLIPQQPAVPQQPANQGDGRLSLQQMLQLQKLKRQREVAAAQEQQQQQPIQGAAAAPAPSNPSSTLELHKLQQEFQQQQQQLQELHQQQLLLQSRGGGLPGAVEAGNGHNSLLQGGATQGLAGGAAAQPPSLQQQPQHQDEDLAMFANMFHQDQQQNQDVSGVEPTAV